MTDEPGTAIGMIGDADGHAIRTDAFQSLRATLDAVVDALVAARKVDDPVVGAVGRGGESTLVTQLLRVAHPGQVLVTEAAAAAVDLSGADVALLPLGLHRLRDVLTVARLTQVIHPDLRIAFPPPRTLEDVAHNLHLETTSFVGRDGDVDELRRLLASPGIITLTGSGGVGKSRVAAHTAALSLDRWRDGVWLIDLHGAGEADVAHAVLRALDVADDHGQQPMDRVVDHLEGRDLLLVLDGCEGVMTAISDLVVRLRSACPTVTVLATSREPLGVAGEVVRTLSPLDVEHATSLFVDRATTARSTFAAIADLDIVVDICRRLDGIPLAIELAAARARSMSAESIQAGLDDRFRLLTGGAARTVARHATLLASIEWSHSLLSEVERVAFRRLAVLGGGWDLEAAEDIVGWEPLDRVDVLDLVSSLVDKSLVMVNPDGRHHFTESVLHFALDRLVEEGEADSARQRHLDYFLGVAVALGEAAESTADSSAIARLGTEEENIRSAIDWARATDPAAARRIAVALTPYWILRGRYLEARLALEPWSDDPEALVALGQVHLLAMDAAAGFGMAESMRALEMASVSGDSRTQARSLGHLGFVESYLGMPSGADRLRDARVLAQRSSDSWALLWALVGDYWSAGIARDDHRRAADVLDEIEALGVSLENAFLSVITDLGRGTRACRVDGDLRDALTRLERAVDRCRELGEPVMEMFTVCALAEALTLAGELDRARAQLTASQRRLESSARGRADVVTVAIAGLADAEGDDDAAFDAVSRALPAVRAVGGADLVASALVVLGRRDPTVLDEALQLARTLGNRRLEADALACAGQHHDALAIRQEAGFLPAVVDSLEAIAVGTLASKRSSDAAAVLGAVQAHRERHGWVRRPRDRARVLHGVDALRAALGDRFDSAWADGARLELAAAVRVATRGRAAGRSPGVGWSSLSPTESSVVELVASGLSNPEVAQRLHMSRATVKTHLLHVYAKVGVANRAELAAAWATRDRADGSQPPG